MTNPEQSRKAEVGRVASSAKLIEKFIDMLSNDFARLSGVLLAISAGLSILFLIGCLSRFDLMLIMVLEYTDLIKFIAIGASLSVIYFPFLFFIILLNNLLTRSTVFLIIAFSVAIAATVFIAYLNHFEHGNFYTNIAFDIVQLALILVGLFSGWSMLISDSRAQLLSEAIGAGFGIAAIAAIALTGGDIYAFIINHRNTAYSLTIKDNNTSRTISNAKLILFTSHHIIVKAGGLVAVFPTADVQQMTSSSE